MAENNCKIKDFLKSKWSKKNIDESGSTKSSTDDEIKDGKDEGFDDIVIDQTNERINQALDLSTSTETKANIMLGSIGLIFTLGATLGLTYLSHIVKQNSYFILPLGAGSLLLIASFVLAFLVINPRNKLKLITPRKLNNLLADLSLNDVKYNLKHNLIQNFEITDQGIKEDMRYLRSSIVCFVLGIVLLSTPFLIKISVVLINKITHG